MTVALTPCWARKGHSRRLLPCDSPLPLLLRVQYKWQHSTKGMLGQASKQKIHQQAILLLPLLLPVTLLGFFL